MGVSIAKHIANTWADKSDAPGLVAAARAVAETGAVGSEAEVGRAVAANETESVSGSEWIHSCTRYVSLFLLLMRRRAI